MINRGCGGRRVSWPRGAVLAIKNEVFVLLHISTLSKSKVDS
jgi:hypothetical protein